ncbi:contractile injection system protein, VgrG/Pvc8 family [Pseudomonas sp. TNT2022 ID1044]|uniref:type VI secretion system Vgr family protein n=1 Tax=Pseudomonas sp. TNT2022 ID1044 TaxID=2942636 RepID=UPI0023625C82|nr:contractile injection system protein, VgrG/Pvc8 family [Pseudomonas sp. TNT2022 ID1044]MDD0997779.1 contractile injection system protein, VgrG/Pvc8 family [Pseudomonas sp. TNT2022 ID1044]
MFDPVNEPEFRLDVAGLSDAFEVLAFTGREAISEPFVFDLQLLVDDPALDLASLLYRSASLHFGPQGNSIHGQLQELVQRDHGSTLRLCHVRLGPRLACLAQRFSQRIFSARTVPQILDQVLKEHGIVGQNRRFELERDYPLRDYCTQYRESDLQFIQRLCAQQRLHYHFEHRSHGHCVVFADGQGHFCKREAVDFRAEGNQPALRRFEVQRCVDSTLQSAQGHSDLATLRSGQLMPLCGHPVRQWNHLWLLTHVEHQGSQDWLVPYSNQVRAIHCEAPFEPPHCVVKPRMHSLQRAWVVDVDEDQPDPSRPVAVQFDWLYQGEGAAPSHCWLPLAPELESAGVGPLSEGAEVVVSFIEGDPDQPLITGVIHQPASVMKEQATEASSRDEDPPEGVQDWLRSGEPLLLLCLLPGGGSFNHCAQALCTCRALTQSGRSGAA